MMTKRRDFIKKSAGIAAGSLILPTLGCKPANKKSEKDAPAKAVSEAPASPKMRPGIQIYSVRNQLKEDFQQTMKKVADTGYKIVEGYGLGSDGMYLGSVTPADYKKTVDDLGMSMISTHSGYFTADDASQMIDAAKASGVEYLVTPWIPQEIRKSADDYKAIAENFNKVGELCKAAGLKFGYHNHDFEFQKMDGQVPQEILMNETQAGLVVFEADIFWVNHGGYDPVALIQKYPGRIELIHVKDATANKEEATVGQGVIDFKSIFDTGKKSGLKDYFVEDEREDDPFGNIKADFDYISKQPWA